MAIGATVGMRIFPQDIAMKVESAIDMEKNPFAKVRFRNTYGQISLVKATMLVLHMTWYLYEIVDTLRSCCEKYGVHLDCIGICMGTCKETPWRDYEKHVGNDQMCDEHLATAKMCCRET